MSVAENDTFIERMWNEHRVEYLLWCKENNAQFDLKDFWVWLEDRDLVPELQDE